MDVCTCSLSCLRSGCLSPCVSLNPLPVATLHIGGSLAIIPSLVDKSYIGTSLLSVFSVSLFSMKPQTFLLVSRIPKAVPPIPGSTQYIDFFDSHNKTNKSTATRLTKVTKCQNWGAATAGSILAHSSGGPRLGTRMRGLVSSLSQLCGPHVGQGLLSKLSRETH